MLIGYVGPVNGYLSQRAELRSEQANLARLEATHRDLTSRLRSLERNDVLEAQARERGLVKPGELGFLLKRSDLEPPPEPPERRDDGIWGWLGSRF